jgi:catechol 2,3-dioxygenase-like lactoylglutathione lyase family enzyme
MAGTDTMPSAQTNVGGPPQLKSVDHVSMPCRDLDEGIRFYRDVLGGEMVVQESAFALFKLAGTRIGIGSAGCTFMEENAEYPHLAFVAEADQLSAMKDWLAACGVPSSNFWTRQGIEALMFFRDPSGNVIELFCYEGFEGSADLPRGPARGHGNTIDIDALRYNSWGVPGA